MKANFRNYYPPEARIVLFHYIISIICLLLIGLSQLKAQSFEENNFRLYTTKDGLSNNDIWSVAQDAYGYIWVATKKGLNRFDGNSFQHFFADTSRNSLPQDWVSGLKMLDNEELAAITQSQGIHIINTKTLTSYNLIIPPDSLKAFTPVNEVRDLLKDKVGNIFVITATGFYQFNRKKELVFRYDRYSRNYIIEKKRASFANNMIMPNSNIILLSSPDGLYVYRVAQKDLHRLRNNDDSLYHQIAVENKRFWFTHGNEKSFSVQIPGENSFLWFDIAHKTKHSITLPFSINNRIFDETTEVVRLNDEQFVINARIGFYTMKYDAATDRFAFSSKNYFGNYFCSALLLDRNNRLLIATDKGLFRQKRPNSTIEQATVSSQGSSFKKSTHILSIAIANNKVFTGTVDEGLLVFDRDSLKIIKQIAFSKDPNWKGMRIVDEITVINEDTLLTGPQGFWVNTSNLATAKLALANDSLPGLILAMHKDSRNNIYITKNTGRPLYFFRNHDDKKFSVVDNPHINYARIKTPVHINEDPDGNIWFSSHGMIRFNYRLQKFDKLLDSFPSFRIPRSFITSNLAFDKEGNIYFGVSENGLVIYDALQNRFSQFTRTDGLPDNNIRAVYLHNNKVWLGTESGLANYDLFTKKISSFGIADGMPPDAFTSNSFCYDPVRQQLYGAFNNIIVRFKPDQLLKNDSPPLFFIENISSGRANTIFHPGETIEVSYKHNDFVVNLGSVNFEDANQQQFAYRFMNDKNQPWQEIGSQRSIIFSNLSPGKHRLQVKVYVRNNSWPEQVKEIMINIRPPFWKAPWFIVLVSLVVLVGLILLYNARIKAIRQKANIDRQLAELEMKGLHAQMNPHFIFNSLNSIKEMILEDEKQNASRYLSKFAQLIRTNLEQSRQTFITVKQCIDHLHQYLEMEKIRFDKFNYLIEMDEDLPTEEIRMAPMLIQPLVENAIWHGLHNRQGEKNLVIRFYRSGEQLVCEIEDNGIGISESRKIKTGSRPAHRSLGISNIQARLIVLNEKYKMNSSLAITDRSELQGKKTGTLATLRLNI